MLHEPAAKSGKDPAEAYKMGLGVKMFIIYAIAYIGFVAINIAKPLLMEKIIVLGLNLATVYGFSLIFFALFLALIYNVLCTNKEAAMSDQKDDQEVKSC
jgi:TRAP-type C4-dicarboxylate transport system permease small subunit